MARNKPKALVVPEYCYGVCLWEVDGSYVSIGDGQYLSLEGVIGDARIERKMREAAHYWLEEPIGQPFWIQGARQISNMEYEVQMERLLDGKIPDEVEQWRQANKKFS